MSDAQQLILFVISCVYAGGFVWTLREMYAAFRDIQDEGPVTTLACLIMALVAVLTALGWPLLFTGILKGSVTIERKNKRK